MERRHLIKNLLSFIGGGFVTSISGEKQRNPLVVAEKPAQPQLVSLACSFKEATNGKIYIGEVNSDPSIYSNQLQVYIIDANGCHLPISQPIKLNAEGYPVYNGEVAEFVVEKAHSLSVYNAYNRREFYFPILPQYNSTNRTLLNLTKPTTAEKIGVLTNVTGVDNLQKFISNAQWQFSNSVLKNGGRNDKVTDNTSLIQSMIDNMSSGYIVIEYGCKWRPSMILVSVRRTRVV